MIRNPEIKALDDLDTSELLRFLYLIIDSQWDEDDDLGSIYKPEPMQVVEDHVL